MKSCLGRPDMRRVIDTRAVLHTCACVRACVDVPLKGPWARARRMCAMDTNTFVGFDCSQSGILLVSKNARVFRVSSTSGAAVLALVLLLMFFDCRLLA